MTTNATATIDSFSFASKTSVIASWTIRILLGTAFLAAGTAKLVGVHMMVETFRAVGLGQWFRYVTGAIEIAGAIGLFVPGLTGVAALVLGVTMLGALTAHALVLPTTFVPAAVLGILAFGLAAMHRNQIKALIRR